MAAIRSDLELDVSDALDEVERVKDALTEAFEQAGDSLTASIESALAQFTGVAQVQAEVDVDTTSAEQAIQQVLGAERLEVDVFADTSAAVEGIDDIPTAIRPIVIPIQIDADALQEQVTDAIDDIEVDPIDIDLNTQTQESQDATEELANSSEQVQNAASGAAGAITALTAAADGLSVAAGVAVGEAQGLSSVIAGIGPNAGAAATGIGAAAAAVGFLVSQAEGSVAAEERLNLVFGEQADAIKEIDIGGLTGNLSDLAKSAGSSGSSIKQSLSTLGQLAAAEGLTNDETKTLTEQFTALSLRAVALNPQLGEAGQVLNQLTPALARGGRFASRFGISLTSAQITARALADTGKQAAKDLTILERSAAGAAIATEQLGDKLGTDFSSGIEQTSVRFKALQKEIKASVVAAGAPLVEPVLNILESIAPVAQTVAEVLGDLGAAVVGVAEPIVSALVPAVKALAVAAKVVEPVVSTIADVLGAIPAPIIIAAAAIASLSPVLDAVAFGLFAVGGAIDTLTVAATVNPILAIVTALVALGVVTGVIPDDILAIAAAVAVASAAIVVFSGEALTLGAAFSVALGPIGLTIAAIGVMAKVLGFFDGPAKEAKLDVEGLTQALFEGVDGLEGLSDAIATTTQDLARYVQEQAASNDDADSVKQSLETLGVGYSDISEALQLTEGDFRQFKVNLLASADGTAVAGDQVEDLIGFLNLQRRTLQATQSAQIEELRSTGAITEEQFEQIKARRQLNDAVAGSTEATGDYTQALNDANVAAEENTKESISNSQAWLVLAQAIGTGAVQAEDFQAIAQRFGVSADVIQKFATDTTKAIDSVTKSIIQAVPETTSFTDSFVKAQEAAFGDVVDAGKDVQKAQADFAKKQTEGLDSQRKQVDDARGRLEDAKEDARRATEDANKALDEANAELARARAEDPTQAATPSQDIFDALQRQQKALEDQQRANIDATAGVNDANAAVADANNNLARASRDAADALAENQQKLADAQKALTDAIDPQKLIDQLNKQAEAIGAFNENIAKLIAQGNTRAAQEAAKLGPAAGGKFAQGLLDAGPDIASATNTALLNVDAQTAGLEQRLRTEFVPRFGEVGKEVAKGLADQYGVEVTTSMPQSSAGALEAVAAVFGDKSPQLREAAAKLGLDASDGFNGSTKFTEGSELAIQSAAEALRQDHPELTQAAAEQAVRTGTAFKTAFSDTVRLTADDIQGVRGGFFASEVADEANRAAAARATDLAKAGSAVVDGVVAGIAQKNPSLAASGRGMVTTIEDSFNQAAGIQSPSTLFATGGTEIVAGIALGINEALPTLFPLFNTAVVQLSAFANKAGILIGAQLAAGLAQGLTGVPQTLEAAGEQVVTQVHRALNRKAEIQSPSKLFARSGEEMVAGLAVGFEQGTQQVVDAATASVGAAASAVANTTFQTNAVAPTGGGGGFTEEQVTRLTDALTAQKAGIVVEGPLVGEVNNNADPLHIGAEIAWQVAP